VRRAWPTFQNSSHCSGVNVMNAGGMSWRCHILHRDLIAWSKKSNQIF
jgi:hypothetical protein